jgi:hypothetical protein
MPMGAQKQEGPDQFYSYAAAFLPVDPPKIKNKITPSTGKININRVQRSLAALDIVNDQAFAIAQISTIRIIRPIKKPNMSISSFPAALAAWPP